MVAEVTARERVLVAQGPVQRRRRGGQFRDTAIAPGVEFQPETGGRWLCVGQLLEERPTAPGTR